MSGDKLFQESIAVFGTVTTTTEKPKDIKTAILSVLKGGSLTHKEIKEQVSKLMGKEVPNQYSTLNGLVKKNEIVKKDESYSLKK